MSMKIRALLRRRIIIPVLILLAGLVVLLIFLLQPKPEQQPIDFPHVAMVQNGVQCLYCHQTARFSPAAGIPSVQKCMGCHDQVDPLVPVIKQVAGYWDRQEPIPWVRVNRLPRFVFFSHQVHVNGGQNCEFCHGDVGQMTIAVPVVRMNMGWCLNCHEKQTGEVNANRRLEDCVICHR